MNARQLLAQIQLSDNTSSIGFLGETKAMQALRNAGLSVQATAYSNRKNSYDMSDLLVNNKHKIEVKTAKQNKSGYYKICLEKRDKHGQATLNHSDYVLIQLISSSGLVHVLFIPVWDILGKKSLHISIGNKLYTKYQTSYAKIGRELK